MRLEFGYSPVRMARDNPRWTALPLVTTATRFPFAVYLKASSGQRWISRQGSATPGVYARDRSPAVTVGLVGTTLIFPGRPSLW